MLAIWLLLIVGVCIYSIGKYKKGYIYSFIMLYSILPNNFAIAFRGQILSFNYLLILYFVLGIVITNKGKIKLRFVKQQKQWTITILAVMLFQIGINFLSGGSSILEIILFVFTDILVFLCLINEVQTLEEIEKCIQYYCIGSCILILMAIINIVLGVNMTACLFTVNSETSYIVLADRLGISRVRSTYNSITFAHYCAFAIPLFNYQYSKHKNLFWLVMLLLDVVVIAFTGTRGAFVVVILYMLIFLISEKKLTVKALLRTLIVIISMGIFLDIVVKIFPQIYDYVLKYFDAVINVFNSNYVNYEIDNNNATSSRWVQLSIAGWLLKTGKIIFGIGFSAYSQGKIFYYMHGSWLKATAIDVGYAAMLASGGLITLTVYMYLFLAPLKRMYKYIRNMYSIKGLCAILAIFYVIANLESVFYRDNAAVVLLAIIYSVLLYDKKVSKYE